jgi:hypothetical protein
LPVTVCWLKDDPSRDSEPAWGLGRTPGRDLKACLFADFTQFNSIETLDTRYPPLEVWKFDVGGSYPLANGLIELGAGTGLIHFSSEKEQDVSVTRFTVTPLRIVTRPFLFVSYFFPNNPTVARISSTFKFYLKETAVYGKLSACQFHADFATDPARNCVNGGDGGFFTDGDLVGSYGVLVDLTELLPLLGRIPGVRTAPVINRIPQP